MVTKANIRTIGNSKGLIIPKKMLAECGIEQEVSLVVKDKTLVVKPVKKDRKWSDFKRNKQKVDFINNDFDKIEWTW
ncbi:MAG: AbrB/MazE/SpoVT family DNA-binding domain-containing protein [Cyclobacteriaceae bacterium]|nr:AbrB/MazE/SpoVT family DNA-binding domain-containing protein [Cyclobacteriaceae bacterium]